MALVADKKTRLGVSLTPLELDTFTRLLADLKLRREIPQTETPNRLILRLAKQCAESQGVSFSPKTTKGKRP